MSTSAISEQEHDMWAERLARIFIRAKDPVTGKMESISCLIATKEQFDEWFKSYIASRIAYPDDTIIDKAAKISLLDDLNFSPTELTKDDDSQDLE